MREIKFRAWDDTEKKYIYSRELHCHKIGKYHRFCGGGSHDDYIDMAIDELPIEQYTGLKDKNGREIYEGDIIGNGTDCAVVKYGVKNCGCCHIVYGFSTDTILVDLSGSAEVVGNIHENQELLEG